MTIPFSVKLVCSPSAPDAASEGVFVKKNPSFLCSHSREHTKLLDDARMLNCGLSSSSRAESAETLAEVLLEMGRWPRPDFLLVDAA
jgi:hypothetical protein